MGGIGTSSPRFYTYLPGELRKIWTSTLSKRIKIRLFIATVESVLLYDTETWAITQTMKKQLNGCYTRMLLVALNVSRIQHIPNIQPYGELRPVSTNVQQRRMRLAGHCVRHDDEVANKLVLWQPTDGHANRGKQKITYVDNQLQDTGLENTNELQTVMMDRGCWKGCVFNAGRPERRPR